jgi:hypothetical protein
MQLDRLESLHYTTLVNLPHALSGNAHQESGNPSSAPCKTSNTAKPVSWVSLMAPRLTY